MDTSDFSSRLNLNGYSIKRIFSHKGKIKNIYAKTALHHPLVDQILAEKQKDSNADTSALERQIDEMVYELYGLTPEEIAVVEGKG